MTPESWRRIKQIASAALDEPPLGRAAYLDRACNGDLSLRRDVESLIDSTLEAADMFETPTVVVAAAHATFDTLNELETSRIGERIGAYRIVDELGSGGMGAAYLAVRADEAYDKTVAIKVLKRGMDTEALLQRFRHERQILATLDHPNIARLLDGGSTSDGLPYLVMEYVDGVPIDRYCDEQRLSIPQRIALFRSVCDAVQHAHDHHVVHRDLKPANVLVTRWGVPKLLDFGIAKLLTPDVAADGGEPTILARAMTRPYASPEQVQRQPITPATDVYSLGVLLFELLTDCRPYRLEGRSVSEIDEAICHEEPPLPSSAAQQPTARMLAGDIDNIVLMALRKQPARRYATARDLSDDLGRYLAGHPVVARRDHAAYRLGKFLSRHRVRLIETAVAILVIGTIFALAAPFTNGRPVPSRSIDSVAVVPLTIPPNDTQSEYLADGLTETLIEAVSALPRVRIPSRTAMTALKGRTLEAGATAASLNVSTLLVGDVVEHGNDISLSLALVGAADHRDLWRQRYAGTVSELAALRDRITRDVVRQLGENPDGSVSRRKHSSNSEAYQLYLKGRYVWNKRTEQGFQRGLEYFGEALKRDPRYALAYTGIADCYNLLGIWGALSPNEAMPQVKHASITAIGLDDSLAEAHTSLAFVHWVYDWDWVAARAEFSRALQLEPDYPTAHDWYAYYLASLGQMDEAIREITRAQQLDPVSQSINTDAGEIYYWAGHYDRAIAELQSVLQVEPEFAMAHNILGLTYLELGRTAEAVEELETANRLSSGPRMLSTLAYGYGAAGAPAQARNTLTALQRLSNRRYTSAFAVGVAYLGTGDNERALTELERAFDERSDTMAILRVYPLLKHLRNEPRFRDLVRRVGLPARAAGDGTSR